MGVEVPEETSVLGEIHLHKGDLPDTITFGDIVAVDTEAMGLDPHRDALCVVQLSAGDGTAHLVQLERGYNCPNLKALLADTKVLKIFHFARFDVAMIKAHLGVDCAPVWCTKIASILARTYTDQHGLKHVSKELLGVDLSKAQQSSDWGREDLTKAQQEYAASDVFHLHQIRTGLLAMLEREGRVELAQACFDFLPARAALDLAGWAGLDVFSHSPHRG